MTENGQIMLKIEYYYTEIDLWENFETLTKTSPKILIDYLIKHIKINT